MLVMHSLLIATVLAAAPEAETGSVPAASPAAESVPTAAELRQVVQRSLVFLEKSGGEWWTSSKCASCHHVPISIWSLTEARNRGFTVDTDSLDKLQDLAFASYVEHPKLKPVSQDGTEAMSLNTVYLALAAFDAPARDSTTQALKTFVAHLVDTQQADGSWLATGKYPPVEDVTEVRTMQTLLVLATARARGLLLDTETAFSDRALAWLRKTAPSGGHQALVFRLLVAMRFESPEEVATLAQRLLDLQNADGGWSQDKDRPSDALATGESIYALALTSGLEAARDDARKSAIVRAQAWLARTQNEDGSWRVPVRSVKNKGLALSHYGTGWAAIGLMRTLPDGATPADRN